MEPLSHVCPLSGWVSPVPGLTGPLSPVMYARCLSVGCMRFWGHRILLGRCTSLAVGLLGDRVSPVSDAQSPIGFSRYAPMRCDWGGCFLYHGVVVSQYDTVRRHIFKCPGGGVTFMTQIRPSLLLTAPVVVLNVASSDVHVRSPFQSSLSPDSPVSRLLLRQYPWLRTPPLPATPAGIRDRHWTLAGMPHQHHSIRVSSCRTPPKVLLSYPPNGSSPGTGVRG
jgi:hypothetical protein